jgi:hypothetical protein
VDMIKVEVEQRQRPDRNVTCDDLLERLQDELEHVDFDALAERFLTPDDISFEYDVLEFASECFKRFFDSAFGEEGTVSLFQAKSFCRLLRDAFEFKPVSGRVIAAGTGFGKTEAFLLPILYFAGCRWFVRAERIRVGETKQTQGLSALLLYPRVDLCNNQAERLLKYVMHLNKALTTEWTDLHPSSEDENDVQPLRIAVAHSRIDQIRIRCPLCEGEIPANDTQELQRAYIVPVFTENRRDVAGFRCDRSADHQHVADYLTPQLKTDSKQADFGITTVDTLHRRLMDDHGRTRIFHKKLEQTRFVVVDEMHIYEGQAGSHVSQILRRCRQRIRRASVEDSNPVFVGASATAGDPIDLARRMFDAPVHKETLIQPEESEKLNLGIEYYFFLQSAGSRFLDNDDDDTARQFVSEQATMIQAAMCLSHGMKRPAGVGLEKRRTLGFIDSIDVATRLAGNLDNAEWQKIPSGDFSPIPLFAMRHPIGVPGAVDEFNQGIRDLAGGRGFLVPPDERFRLPLVDCPKSESQDCNQPPHPLLQRCSRYENGECWHAMARPNSESMLPLPIQVHRSGSRQWANPDQGLDQADHDNWRLLVSTSALEVGFDHPELIATWQYHAPPSVSSFVQRKGRGGRGVTDFPITMVVLGKSFSDVFCFQDHLKLVNVNDSDIASILDETNPSVREQHLFCALLDYCAHSREFHGAYGIKDLKKIADACGSEGTRTWLRECFKLSNTELTEFLDKLKKMVLEIWNKTLDFSALKSDQRPPKDIKPVDLFLNTPRDELTVYLDRLRQSDETPNPNTVMWLQAALKAANEALATNYRQTKVVDFCKFLPQEFIVDDVYVPSTTIPVPIGRYVDVVDTNGQHLDVEPAEFALKCFLPGGFKIRYGSRLWMAPWTDVPSKPRDAESTRIWVATDSNIVARKQYSLVDALDKSTFDQRQKDEIQTLLGGDCLVAEVGTLRLQNLGKARHRKFSMNRATLRIYDKRPEDANPNDFLTLERDPHVVPKFTCIPQHNSWKSFVLTDKLPFAKEAKAKFYDRYKLNLCFYANLVNCYPKNESAQTIVLRFWDNTSEKPIAPAIPLRTQALEFDFNPIEMELFDVAPLARVFWIRFADVALEKLIIELGVLKSVYSLGGLVDLMRFCEPEQSYAVGHGLPQLTAAMTDCQDLSFVDSQLVQWCLEHIDELDFVLKECREWVIYEGVQRSAIDSVASALCRAAAQTINVSPTAFRRQSFFTISGPKIVLFDDVEGGSGNTRRLRDAWDGKTDLAADLATQAKCQASEVDRVVYHAFDSGISADSLFHMSEQGTLPDDFKKGVAADACTRACLRLRRLAQSPEIAAFNLFVRAVALRTAGNRQRPTDYWRLYKSVFDTQAVDVRAEALKQDFLDQDIGSPNELRARVQEMMPLCEGACPECLLGDAYGKYEYVDREVLRLFLNDGRPA